MKNIFAPPHWLKFAGAFLIVFFSLSTSAQQSEPEWKIKINEIKFKPIFAVQFWGSWTSGQEVFTPETDGYRSIDDRLELQLRRTRLGFSVEPFPRFTAKFVTSIDFVGRDVRSATQGGANNGANPIYRLWEVTGQWQMKAESQASFLTIGYMVPQIGRESITGVYASSGMEKVWVQNYVRRHMVGTGPGRAFGINLGGLSSNITGNVHFDYNIGIFNPVFHSNDGNSTGDQYAPLFCAKTTFHFGDPESQTYSRGHKVNYFSKRKGISIGLQSTYQGETDLFNQSALVGLDLLFNWKHLNIDGEWHWMRRQASDPSNSEVQAQVGYLKLGYNIHLDGKTILEPIVMASTYRGEILFDDQTVAGQVGMPSGQDHTVDIGLNLYLNPKLKIGLHLTLESGDLGESPVGSPINNQFSQGGIGPINRGDWIGLGMTFGI